MTVYQFLYKSLYIDFVGVPESILFYLLFNPLISFCFMSSLSFSKTLVSSNNLPQKFSKESNMEGVLLQNINASTEAEN